ncbi:hypothetical protein [Streptomyces sp.]|nr:hypothetical protein [Streptomyces sp.]
MAWDEWERIKADATAQQSASTRLNQVVPGAGNEEGEQADL